MVFVSSFRSAGVIECMMKRKSVTVALWLLACVVATQAQTAKGPTSASDAAWSVGTRPAMTLTAGEVERVDKEHGEVVINHGDLPNLGMEAMTMGFAVADKRMLDRLKPGDKVRFNAEIKNGEATVTYIESVR
jgi:Cu(I)/Ag(I) efflux system membrane protein CusA/SilA